MTEDKEALPITIVLALSTVLDRAKQRGSPVVFTPTANGWIGSIGQVGLPTSVQTQAYADPQDALFQLERLTN